MIRSALPATGERSPRDRFPRAGVEAKGRGRKLTSRVFRTPASRVTVELKKGDGLGAIAEALELALAAVRAEIGERDQAAA